MQSRLVRAQQYTPSRQGQPCSVGLKSTSIYGTSDADVLQLQWVKAEGVAHPVLKIEIGLASRECHGPELDEYAEPLSVR